MLTESSSSSEGGNSEGDSDVSLSSHRGKVLLAQAATVNKDQRNPQLSATLGRALAKICWRVHGQRMDTEDVISLGQEMSNSEPRLDAEIEVMKKVREETGILDNVNLQTNRSNSTGSANFTGWTRKRRRSQMDRGSGSVSSSSCETETVSGAESVLPSENFAVSSTNLLSKFNTKYSSLLTQVDALELLDAENSAPTLTVRKSLSELLTCVKTENSKIEQDHDDNHNVNYDPITT